MTQHEERDRLISRVVDRIDLPEDWQRLDGLADRDERVFDQLLDSLRGDSELRSALEPAVRAADRVELADPVPVIPVVRSRAASRVASLGGWLAAGVLAMSWWGAGSAGTPNGNPGTPESHPPSPAGRSSGSTGRLRPRHSDTAPQARLASEQVLRELPNVLVETRPLTGNRVEVIFVRRRVERAVVSDAFVTTRDESGQPFRGRVDLTQFASQRDD